MAIRFGIGVDELSDLVHIYPTLSVGIGRIGADRAFRTVQRFRHLARLGRLFD